MSLLELCCSIIYETLSIKYATKILTFVAFLNSIIFNIALVAVKGANQNCAVSTQNDTVISEYQSAVLLQKVLTQLKGGITVHAESLLQQTAYCKLWEELDCGSKIINFTAIRVPFLNIFLVPSYPRYF